MTQEQKYFKELTKAVADNIIVTQEETKEEREGLIVLSAFISSDTSLEMGAIVSGSKNSIMELLISAYERNPKLLTIIKMSLDFHRWKERKSNKDYDMRKMAAEMARELIGTLEDPVLKAVYEEELRTALKGN